MKRSISKIACLLLVFLASASAKAQFYVNGFYYGLKPDNGAEIRNKFGDPVEYSGDITIPASVIIDDEVYTVTSICSETFLNCSNLTSVVLPNTMKSIGDRAFEGCSSLKSVVLPNSIKTIDYYAFKGCSSLTEVVLPKSIEFIGGSAFGRCTGLSSIVFPNAVKEIGAEVFSGCTSLTSVDFPNSVEVIGNSVFRGCSSLISFNGNYASEDHRCLVVDGVLNSFAPEGLTSYSIPNSVKVIGSSAFAECTNLTSMELPNSVKEIGSLAFFDCSNLTSMSLSECLTSIGFYAFRKTGLSKVVIPNSVTSIGSLAFGSCKNLRSVVLGSSVNEMWSDIFNDTPLEDLTSLNTTPPALAKQWLAREHFEGLDLFHCVLKVPAESVESYKEAEGWCRFDYFHNIKALTEDDNIFVGLTNPSKTNHDTKAFNLQGVEVGDGYRGIVIQNGKKVLRK